MGPCQASELQPSHEVDSDGGSETSQHSQPLSLHATTLCGSSNTEIIFENHKRDKVTMPSPPPPLPSRGQPFPFILPQPLGPLSPPITGSNQPYFTSTSAPGNTALFGTCGLPDARTWGARGANPDRAGGFVMPNPAPAATTGLPKCINLENETEPGPFPSHHAPPRQFGSQNLAQPAANMWHTPATETRIPPRGQEHGFVLERPSAGGTYGDNLEVPRYHKCDECHEAFTTSSWLKRHRTTHFGRFRCGCGATYIDKVLLLEHQNNKECEQRPASKERVQFWGTPG
ncbi:hypothetical protein FJTKL_11977 [Diaporthe vaccinii]|uniref:C2H2-type domain-containing protein n=1 Tax=Diaporthe vaccinii TaxID=105482 RepID=A0ABR4FAR4_9PEZI